MTKSARLRTLTVLGVGLMTGALVATLALPGGVDELPSAADGSEPLDQDEGEQQSPPTKSIGFFVGSDLTDDGSTLLGGFGHEPSSHWIEIIPRQTHPEGATTEVGVTDEARIPGELTEIPQADETYKYVSSLYSEFAGFPPPLTNGGLNEEGVAARDIWSPSRPELVEMAEDAAPQEGPQYSDLARAAMERADSAEAAVDVVGELMEEHGFSTYGGNSHLFADEDEGWVFINYAHPDGKLWAAERLGSDDVRVSYPGYIRDFPVDHEDDPDFKASDELVDFAEDQGWWDGEGDTLDLREVFGVGEYPADADAEDYIAPEFYQDARDPEERTEELRQIAEERGGMSVDDMMALVRDPRWSTDHAGYGQVAHLRPDVHDELQTLWTATTSSITTPYVPIPIGAEEVPPEFRQHRYMTSGSAATFLDEDYQVQEGTRYATREFKRLLYLACEEPGEFYTDVTGALESLELEMLAERDEVEAEAQALFDAGDADAARELLTDNAEERLLESMELAMELSDEVEDELRDADALREPSGTEAEGDLSETPPASSQDMGGTGLEMVNCYEEDLHGDYPRGHGAYTAAAQLSGDDRLGTAIAVSRSFSEADDVVLAQAGDYADALAGGPLAAAVDAPLLLTETDELRDDVADEVTRLGAETAHVLGGENAVSEEVAEELREAGVDEVKRHEGTDRFATAVEVAEALADITGEVDSAYLVEGTNPDPDRGWPDAVAASGVAAFTGQPILPTRVDDLPDATADALEALEVDEVRIVGGTAAVSDEVQAAVSSTVDRVERLDGDNRYETSAAVADHADEVGVPTEHAWVATGRNWPDSLAAGPVAGASEDAATTAAAGPLLLIDGEDLEGSLATRDWLADRADVIDRVTAVGGHAAVDLGVRMQLYRAVMAD